MSDYLALVACGAPLAARVHDVAAAAAELHWRVRVVATASAMNWVDAAAVERVTGFAPLVEQRRPGEPKRFPTPGRVVVCPGTFNSINKLATGIMDNYAAGLVCEALASGTPLTIVPMVSDALWGHPAWAGHLATLSSAGVTFVDVRTGRTGDPQPVDAGTGDDNARTFDPAWLFTDTAARTG
ncbi:flavoprotein [Cryptosporangium aurantiacum]|uniref:Flavoprotein n=1 Tax=Cryptosporangium aurantiacum TaxID=134849 RepID=A0A1M7M742_9ACTN|nr:flavoprotein [Cryptosporangium aurantiacum]SHM86571.1 Flavoprotein [Cryptosporangium aurantiacum]